ncbi:MAG TPA: ABC transporter ATP-binding protein [Acidimicrobiia bacterium]|nr:ABC transporter ATP-binding protein [Acidimicrobiia bacterium]
MHAVEVDNLIKNYDGRPVLKGVSFTVAPGEIFGILGPNGAGKTTTVESIVGLRRPDGGTIKILGLDPQKDRDQMRTRVGVQLQEARLPDRLKVWEALDLYSSFYETPVSWRELADRLGLDDKLDTRFADLSGGQRQRLSIALALVGDPEVAVLDELTTGLDPAARRETWDLIEDVRARGVTVLLVTHSMEEAEHLSDRLALIDQGRVVAVDTPSGLISRAEPAVRIRFVPSSPLDGSALLAMPEVDDVTRTGDQLVVTGTGNVLNSVMAELARHQIIAEMLRVEQTTLDDAFLALTGRATES